MGDTEMTVQERAVAALDAGEATKTACPSKQAVLKKIKDGDADAMSVGAPFMLEDSVVVSHYAVRFKDRQLGESVRQLTMEGFGLK